tara:strand:- start:23765 stop:24568 length:804 start_codon:yes stop_codon:yes gene_type:complete
VSEITIFLLYASAAVMFGGSRLPRLAAKSSLLVTFAFVALVAGMLLHAQQLYALILIDGGFNLSLANTASLVGLELALVALLAAFEPALRGISAGLLLLGALAAAVTGFGDAAIASAALPWQIQAHVLISLLSYGLLTVGAIVAIYAMVQERRLHARKLTPSNHLFAPLETTERLLFGIAAAGFAGLAIAILSGLTFVDNLFAQHLAHKTVFSLLALLVFGALLAGRFFAGWRGTRAVKLYLGGFLLLCVAYFGTRMILEQLDRSWS